MSRDILSYQMGVAASSPATPKNKESPSCKECKNNQIVWDKLRLHFAQILDLYNGQVYPLTMTINFKKFPKMINDANIHRKIQQILIESPSWRKVKYYLFPEYDDNCRLHYHGIIYGCYQSKMVSCMNVWKRKIGFVDKGASREIRYPICCIEPQCTYIQKGLVKKGCWYHYCIKDTKKSGLWTLYH